MAEQAVDNRRALPAEAERAMEKAKGGSVQAPNLASTLGSLSAHAWGLS
jgi:hypothetical protein